MLSESIKGRKIQHVLKIGMRPARGKLVQAPGIPGLFDSDAGVATTFNPDLLVPFRRVSWMPAIARFFEAVMIVRGRSRRPPDLP